MKRFTMALLLLGARAVAFPARPATAQEEKPAGKDKAEKDNTPRRP